MKEREMCQELINGCEPVRYLKGLGWNVFEWQQAVLQDASRRICIDGARQGGKSTILSAVTCHHAKYFPNSLSVILAPTLKQASEDMQKIKAFIARDRTYPRLTRFGSEEIATEKGARILVLTATDDAARGFSNPDIILFDEASRISDDVFEAVRPMITNNPRARIYEISTPNGKQGFFYNHFSNPSWSRYLVRAPWIATDSERGPVLVPITEEEGRETLRKNLKPTAGAGEIRFFFSPRHYDENDQAEALSQMHVRKYLQEYGCEFVDAEDQVFSQDLIEAMFASEGKSTMEEPEMLDGESYAEPDPEFMDEYEYAERRHA